MDLSDCLNNFLQSLNKNSVNFTGSLEIEGQAIKGLIIQCDNPSNSELKRVKDFLVNVEKWKADCREEQTGNALRNNPIEIWSALKQAISTSDDRIALLSIMSLTGFGVSKDEETGQRRAKRATAVLRFLNPRDWGVVDWRVIAMLGLYEKSKYNLDFAIIEAQKYKRNQIASWYDLIDEKAAVEIVNKYRSWRTSKLPRAVDVEYALYGASFIAWPRQASKA